MKPKPKPKPKATTGDDALIDDALRRAKVIVDTQTDEIRAGGPLSGGPVATTLVLAMAVQVLHEQWRAALLFRCGWCQDAGHRPQTTWSLDGLKEHVLKCPNHPLVIENQRLKEMTPFAPRRLPRETPRDVPITTSAPTAPSTKKAEPVRRWRSADLVALVPGTGPRIWFRELVPHLLSVGALRKHGRAWYGRRSEIEAALLEREP